MEGERERGAGVADARRRGEEILERGRELVEQNPIPSVAIAFAVGYLLSGALFSRTTLRLALLGARLYFGPLLRSAVSTGVIEALGLARGSEPAV
jgi:hypothetical protein